MATTSEIWQGLTTFVGRLTYPLIPLTIIGGPIANIPMSSGSWGLGLLIVLFLTGLEILAVYTCDILTTHRREYRLTRPTTGSSTPREDEASTWGSIAIASFFIALIALVVGRVWWLGPFLILPISVGVMVSILAVTSNAYQGFENDVLPGIKEARARDEKRRADARRRREQQRANRKIPVPKQILNERKEHEARMSTIREMKDIDPDHKKQLLEAEEIRLRDRIDELINNQA